MAWNQPGAGNNNDGKDPWTGKPKGSTPPDLEAILNELRKKITAFLTNKKLGNFSPSPKQASNFGIGIIAGVIFAIWFLSGIFIVGPAEQVVVLRLGKYVGTVGPGPHWVPRFIEKTYTVNEQKISTYSYDAEMLTRDENIVSVAVAVQYRINNARDYLFSVPNPNESLQQATASALRQIIGHTNLQDVLTTGREKIRQEVQQQLTTILARYNTGLLITDVAMQPAKAPEEVKEAFDDAIKAQEDKQRFESQARAYSMQVEPIAKGQAQRLLTDAKAYQQQVVLNAKAEITRFLALLPAYEKAPIITRERLYIETIENVYENNNKVFVDSHGSNNMLYLPLDKLTPNAKPKKNNPVSTTPTVLPTPATATAATTAANPASTHLERSNIELPGGYE